jgi:hypothetical protein
MGLSNQIASSRLIQPGVVDNAASRPASPFEGQCIFQKDTDQFLIYNGNAWVCLTPQSAVVNALESTASTSYTNLTTTGPSVTVATGSKALVTITATIDSNSTAGNTQVFAGFDVSGPSTVAANEDQSLNHRLGASLVTQSGTFLVTGLTGGNNVFTMKYKSGDSSITARYFRRNITVVGIP